MADIMAVIQYPKYHNGREDMQLYETYVKPTT